MNIFEELERLKQKQVTVVIATNCPDIDSDDMEVMTPFQVVFTTKEKYENDEEPSLSVKPLAGETMEQTLYRSIVEFDEIHPEYL